MHINTLLLPWSDQNTTEDIIVTSCSARIERQLELPLASETGTVSDVVLAAQGLHHDQAQPLSGLAGALPVLEG